MPAAARVALLLVCGAVAVARGEDEIVDWRDAAQCIDRVCALRGTVALVEDDGPTFRLYFDRERRNVRILLLRGWLVTWPGYEGATIVARGRVQRFRDHVEMLVTDPSNVTVLDATPSPPPSPGPSPTPGELEKLRQRVQELEQRLRLWEGREDRQ
jgi:hypothetical protein